MVAGGADVADVLFHANQVWHEFKAAAMFAGVDVFQTVMYVDYYNAALTNKLIAASPRYVDSKRAEQVAAYMQAGKKGKTPVVQ
jgi:hypothetical protein